MSACGRLLVVLVLSITAASAQLRITDGVAIAGDIHRSSRVLASFGATPNTLYVGVTFGDSLVLPNGITLRGRGITDAAVLVFDEQWRIVGVDHIGGPGRDSIVALSTLSNGDAVVAAVVCADLVVPTTCRLGGIRFSNRGNADIGIAVYRPSGAVRWARLDGDIHPDVPSAIGVDERGGFVLLGTYVTATRVGTFTVSDEAPTSAFLACYTDTGTVSWLRTTTSSDDDPVIPRGAARGGSFCAVVTDTVIAHVAAAGVIGFGDVRTADVNFDFEQYPYVLSCDRLDGRPRSWLRMEGCRGDSIVATVHGADVRTAVVEPRSCQAGTEPSFVLRVDARTLKYVPGGPNSTAAAAAARPDGSMVVGGRYERTMLFDTVSRLPDLLATSFSLQDGWIAAFEPSGRLRSATSLGASIRAEVTSLASRGPALAAAAVTEGQVMTPIGPIGVAQATQAMVIRLADPSTGVATEHVPDADGPVEGIWTVDGRYHGTDIDRAPRGVLLVRRRGSVRVGIQAP